jgi:tRNA G46 methylase TrmB
MVHGSMAAMLLDVGCGGGWALVQIAERFPATSCVGIDVEPYSIELASQLIAERGLTDRCQAQLERVDELAEDEKYTSPLASWSYTRSLLG